MVYLETSEEWQRQSASLLQARPTTTRITTKYNIPNLDSPKYQNLKKRKRDAGTTETKDDAPKIPRAKLVLKTYDPESGVVLKFKTDRAADVGRLIGGLGRMGRHMAALPEKAEAPDTTTEDTPMTDAAPKGSADAVPRQAGSNVADAKTQQTSAGNAGGGGKGKKKKKGKN